MAIIKFSESSTEVTLKFDSGKKVEGEYGVQYMWSCNDDDVFYASEQFNALLHQSKVQQGQAVSIKKVKKMKNGEPLKTNDGKTLLVFAVNGLTLDDLAVSSSDTAKPSFTDMPAGAVSEMTLEARINDIERRLKVLESTQPNKVESTETAMDDLPF